MGLFSILKRGLTKSSTEINNEMQDVFSSHAKVDDDFFDDLEEIMIGSDMGVRTVENVLDDLRTVCEDNHIKKPEDTRAYLMQSIKNQVRLTYGGYSFENKKSVILLIGVNGAGKTTTAGKLASIYKSQGKKVILAAADTYRAAANEQLTEWSKRAGVSLIGGQEGSDPGAVVYDAVASAKAKDADLLIVDTAGRLHNKKNLMNELHKIRTILSKSYPEAYQETLLVLDGTTGQNALSQAKEFSDAADVTGLVITKLDGTAKGGIAVAIATELEIPVKFIGVGEKIEDLQKFDVQSYVDALFDIGKNEED